MTDDVSFARRAVTSGQAVLTVLPQSVQREGYVLRTLEGDPLHRRLHLAWQPQRLPVAVDQLLASVRDVYARQARFQRRLRALVVRARLVVAAPSRRRVAGSGLASRAAAQLTLRARTPTIGCRSAWGSLFLPPQ